MTTTVLVHTTPSWPVKIHYQDKDENGNWVDSWEETVPVSASKTVHVWDARRIIVEELPNADVQCLEQEDR